MSYATTSYMLQFLPVVAGVAVMLLLRNLRLNKDVVKVRQPAYNTKKPNVILSPEVKLAIDLPTKLSDYGLYGPAMISMGSGATHLINQDRQNSWRGYIGDFDNMRSSCFARNAYDSLIMAGLLGKVARRDLCDVALKHLGVLDVRDSKRIKKQTMPESLKIFASGRSEFLEHMLAFDGRSGVLLSYLASYRLYPLKGDDYGIGL